MQIKIVEKFPPNYKEIEKTFDLSDKKPVFTYGDTIFNPHKVDIVDHLMEHEMVHMRQQALVGVDNWWSKYLINAEFRLEQEIEAYSWQYEFVKRQGHLYKTLDAFLDQLASLLSGKMYNNLLDFGKAKSKIRNFYVKR